MADKIYRNRTILNQRGGSLVITNTTDQESVQLSQRSGSNVLMNNLVNSELATNNKQTHVINDNFETVLNDDNKFVKGVQTNRVGNTRYDFKGFLKDDEYDAYQQWKDTFNSVALVNSKFKIQRGGVSGPNGVNTDLSGDRADNPVIGSKVYVVENKFNGYTKLPRRLSSTDEVTDYSPVPDHGNTKPADEKNIKEEDISKSAGSAGSKAPGVLEFGAKKSAATENGQWGADNDAQNIADKVLEIQDQLTPIEEKMGDGGDEHIIVKRNKIETVGAIFNDYPSVRIDEKGRSQPFEMLVSDTGVYKNHDYIPHVEEIDNSSNFPCGQDTKIVGNSYNRIVGSGGISLKTTGATELGGATLKAGFKKININASHGVHIGSENAIELQSMKTIVLRTNRQVYVESSLGVKNNLIVGGGLAVEGQTYLQGVTAPLEVQQTENTLVSGKFATDSDRKLFIGECEIAGLYYPVYAVATDDLIATYPHSHHFNNLPLKLMEANEDVRKDAHNNGINVHNSVAQSYPQMHEKKKPQKGFSGSVRDRILSIIGGELPAAYKLSNGLTIDIY